MRRGYLSEHFTGVASKRLAAVEVNRIVSHQHEFNGVTELRHLLGENRAVYPTRFVYLSDGDDEAIVEDATLTWYDARENDPKRTEWRLYFPRTTVTDCASEGDVLVIGLRRDGPLLLLVVEGGSTIASQILWMFGFADVHPGFSIREELDHNQDRLGFASTLILESLGIEAVADEPDLLEHMLATFDGRYPSTKRFSEFARSRVPGVEPDTDPDGTLMAWMEKELILFRTLEKHFLAERLVSGFAGDVDGFLSYSLSVQNRRKSRVGHALENHFEALLRLNRIRNVRSAVTENGNKPDFLFPGGLEYHDSLFPESRLTMLGAKNTAKDRWRQVLQEADRIQHKHLLTMEPAISAAQTDQMAARNLCLVLPARLHATYSITQQSTLMNVASFLDLVKTRQMQP